jgi:hypothetical protein
VLTLYGGKVHGAGYKVRTYNNLIKPCCGAPRFCIFCSYAPADLL